VEKEWVNISRENGCGMSRALRALVGAGLGGLASPLMMEEECFILNKVRVRKGEEKKGRRMEGGNESAGHSNFRALREKRSPQLFSQAVRRHHSWLPPSPARRESLKRCQSLSVRNENGRWRGYRRALPGWSRKMRLSPCAAAHHIALLGEKTMSGASDKLSAAVKRS